MCYRGHGRWQETMGTGSSDISLSEPTPDLRTNTQDLAADNNVHLKAVATAEATSKSK